ncbi:MAG: hypothetical protein ACQES2_11785 [Pseudomonadota bacterium]
MRDINYSLLLLFYCIKGFCSISLWPFLLGSLSLSGSRLAQVIAFFLPIKVFILASSTELPSYFAPMKGHIELSHLLIILSSLVPFFYFSFILLGVFHRRLIDYHEHTIVNKGLDVLGHRVKRKHKFQIHGRTAKVLSDFFLGFLCLSFIFFIQPLIGLSIFCLLYANFILFFRYVRPKANTDRLTFLKLHRRQFVEYFSSLNFLLSFALIAFFMVYHGLGVYLSIFALLLCRLLFQALNRFTIDSFYIINLLPKGIKP